MLVRHYKGLKLVIMWRSTDFHCHTETETLGKLQLFDISAQKTSFRWWRILNQFLCTTLHVRRLFIMTIWESSGTDVTHDWPDTDRKWHWCWTCSCFWSEISCGVRDTESDRLLLFGGGLPVECQSSCVPRMPRSDRISPSSPSSPLRSVNNLQFTPEWMNNTNRH